MDPIAVPILVYRTSAGIDFPVAAEYEAAPHQGNLEELKDRYKLLEEEGEDERTLRAYRVDIAMAEKRLERYLAKRDAMVEHARISRFGIAPFTYPERGKAVNASSTRDPESGIITRDDDAFMAELLPGHIKTRDGQELTPDDVRGMSIPMIRRLWEELLWISDPSERDILFRGDYSRGSDGPVTAGGRGADDVAAAG